MDLIYFGGVRGLLRKYISNGFDILWIIRECDYLESDSQINANKIIVSDLAIENITDLVEKHIKSKECKCVSYHDNYHDIAYSLSKNLGIDCNIKTNANVLSKNKEISRKLSNDVFEKVVGYHNKGENSTFDNVKELKLPVISKPLSGTGSRSVKISNNHEDLKKIFFESPNDTLFEEFINGQEFSIDTISINGVHKVLMIAEKSLFKKTFVEKSHLVGSKTSSQLWSLLEDKIIAYLNKINHINGSSHIEVKISNNSIYFIECQLRIGGDYLWEAYKIITGDCLIEILYKVDNEENFDINTIKSTRESDLLVKIEFFSWHVYPSNFLFWSGLESGEYIDGVQSIFVTDNPNPCQFSVSSSQDRDLAVIIANAKLEDIEHSMELVVKNIRPVVKFNFE
ncbi:ATP-grasp domain-containing protein [Vibrio coralliilyticus]|uniref:ATP-grasp domain-containing protein n=1 Tax=Vibrio coralliilyticus TaxID=190893 RepID=UPI0015616434|nr:ATP-grasp domain-containing protein [Vibrio coralliilyticus]NRF25484.1 ATP-grasp domain-containing protein [Vibrio coralliilyticus]NRF79453.1 ATP-grasp domain-containing protein [Vibrio coralliilyticus]